MPIPPHNQVRSGALVSIILKEDQPTGRQVQGTVADILTSGNHPHGVKVRLTDGRVGRVQEILTTGDATQFGSTGLQQPLQPQQYGAPPQQQWQSNAGYAGGYSSAPYSDHPPPQEPLSHTRPRDDEFEDLPDGAEQVEHFQSYEASKGPSEDDRNQAMLEKEFPNIDSSLIAALYGDSKDLSGTRETLQELGREEA